MKQIEQEFNPEILQQFSDNPGVSIPGQSLTNDPDNSYPWEGPPRFTKKQDALDYIVSEMLEEDRVINIMDSVSRGVPITDIVYLMLRQGFSQGLFNPDLMLLLAEPLIFVVMALAEKSGVEYILYEGENLEEEIDEEDDSDLPEMLKEKIRGGPVLAQTIQENISREDLQNVELPESVEQQIEEFKPSESLLNRRPQEERSLLERS
jgi:hypothetical protein|tara:strand:- start:32 stop:652 length:621 start_codon:yes stop_codon:yes gene_type:complete